MIRICEICGKEFNAKGRAVTCSNECSHARSVMVKRNNRRLVKVNSERKMFNSFESFCAWAKQMLEGIDLNQYKKEIKHG